MATQCKHLVCCYYYVIDVMQGRRAGTRSIILSVAGIFGFYEKCDLKCDTWHHTFVFSFSGATWCAVSLSGATLEKEVALRQTWINECLGN